MQLWESSSLLSNQFEVHKPVLSEPWQTRPVVSLVHTAHSCPVNICGVVAVLTLSCVPCRSVLKLCQLERIDSGVRLACASCDGMHQNQACSRRVVHTSAPGGLRCRVHATRRNLALRSTFSGVHSRLWVLAVGRRCDLRHPRGQLICSCTLRSVFAAPCSCLLSHRT